MDAFFSGKKNRGSIKRGRESWQSTTTQQIQIGQGGDRTKNHNTKRIGGKIKNNNSLLLLYHGNKISTMFRIRPSPLFNRWLIDSGCGIKIYV